MEELSVMTSSFLVTLGGVVSVIAALLQLGESILLPSTNDKNRVIKTGKIS